MDSLKLRDVTPEGAARLRAFLGRDRLKGHDQDSGTVMGDCIEVAFEYDKKDKVLEVTPKRLPEHLEGEGALKEMLQVALQTDVDRPGHCGVYTYCLTEIDNQTAIGLTYAGCDLEHGTLKVDAQTIEPGKSALAFTAESSKSSVVGIEGTAIYGLDDGITTLRMHYYMLVAASASFNVGLAGGNAGRYSVAVEHPEGFTDGYTYMEPKVIISTRT